VDRLRVGSLFMVRRRKSKPNNRRAWIFGSMIVATVY
jgi:hypothetical protein